MVKLPPIAKLFDYLEVSDLDNVIARVVFREGALFIRGTGTSRERR